MSTTQDTPMSALEELAASELTGLTVVRFHKDKSLDATDRSKGAI